MVIKTFVLLIFHNFTYFFSRRSESTSCSRKHHTQSSLSMINQPKDNRTAHSWLFETSICWNLPTVLKRRCSLEVTQTMQNARNNKSKTNKEINNFIPLWQCPPRSQLNRPKFEKHAKKYEDITYIYMCCKHLLSNLIMCMHLDAQNVIAC